jgi:hypothetical protein
VPLHPFADPDVSDLPALERRHGASFELGRRAFLAAVKQHRPEVLADLLGVESPLFDRGKIRDITLVCCLFDEAPGPLVAWAARWHLSAAWAPWAGLSTLALWQRDKRAREELRWGLPLVPYRRTTNSNLTMSPDPGMEQLSSARRRLGRIRRDADILRIWARAEAEAVERGFVRRVVFRDLERHASWLARFQVSGEAFARIAKSDLAPAKSAGAARQKRHRVKLATSKLAALLELTLRTDADSEQFRAAYNHRA